MAGFAYENDTGVDLTGAKKIPFWIMGENGNERIKVKLAGKSLENIQGTPPNGLTKSIFASESFALTSEELMLGSDGRRYEVDLTGVNLEDITHPFGFELSKGNGAQKQVIYMKGLVYDDDDPVEESALLVTFKEQVITDPLTVQIISNRTQGNVPATLQLNGKIRGGTEHYNIRWDFGDDRIESDKEFILHTFDEPGAYNVTLTTTDSRGETAYYSTQVRVNELEEEGRALEGGQEEAMENENE